MATVQQEVQAALRMNGLLRPGQTEPATHLSFATEVLNVMLSAWLTQGINVPAEQSNTFSAVAGTGSYTVGSGGVFNMTRPASISKAKWKVGDFEHPLYRLTDAEYQDWPDKTLQGFPSSWYYRNAAPLGTFFLLDIPSSADSVVLYTPVRFVAYSSGATAVDLPDGYDEAIRYNLAIALNLQLKNSGAAELDPLIVSEARRSLANIRRLNYRPPSYTTDYPSDERPISNEELAAGGWIRY